MVTPKSATVFGYVSAGNRILQVRTGQILPAGTVLVCFSRDEVATWSNDFYRADSLNGYGKEQICFVEINEPLEVRGYSGHKCRLYGIDKYYSEETPVAGINIESESNNVRPLFTFDKCNVAFLRNSYSNNTLNASSKFAEQPSAYFNKNDNRKAVLKNQRVTISSAISTNKLTTEKSVNGHADVKFNSNTIYVPFGAKNLTIDKSAFNVTNANHISALADCGDSRKYSVLGAVGSNIDIELASLFNNIIVGSSSTISFYTEQANNANNTDLISSSPVTVKIEVIEGPQQTIQYDLDGGLGSKPDSTSAKAGSTCTLARGSGLSKDGNQFRGWKVTYTNFGETDEVVMYVKGGESIVVPDTTTGKVTVTAVYSGMVAHKGTNSKSSVMTIKWDSNAPEGGTAIFSDSDGTYNADKSIKFNKIKIANTPVTVPVAPTLTGVKKVFDGWYDAPTGGNKVTSLTITASDDVTYYAQWLDGYKVIYDATGGEGAVTSGYFNNGATEVEELVMPNDSIQGPKINGVAESPTATDEFNGYFFAGWFTLPNGMGEPGEFGTTTVGESTRYYACYLNTTFLAPASQSTANPRNISGTKYSINYVNNMAKDLLANEKSGDIKKSKFYPLCENWAKYSEKGSDYDESKAYHLYTLLKDSGGNYLDPDKADNWVEFRIISTGQNENDGAGLTFMALHSLPKAYRMNASNTNSGGWASTELRKECNQEAKFTNNLMNRLPATR